MIEAAQPGVAVEPLGRHPVIDGADERRRHVLGEERLRAPKAVDDGEARAERVERLRLEQSEVGAGRTLRRPPVGPAGERRRRRIGRQRKVEPLELLDIDALAPIAVEIGDERADPRRGHVHVAIDGARKW